MVYVACLVLNASSIVAAAKVLIVKVGTPIETAHLPIDPTALFCACYLHLLWLKWIFLQTYKP
jgi:hypothetical protein